MYVDEFCMINNIVLLSMSIAKCMTTRIISPVLFGYVFSVYFHGIVNTQSDFT